MDKELKEVLLYIKQGDLSSFVHALEKYNYNINLDFENKIGRILYDQILNVESDETPENNPDSELDNFFTEVAFRGWDNPYTFINVAAYYNQYHICKYILENIDKKELHKCAESLMKFFCNGSDDIKLFKVFEKFADEPLLKEAIEWVIESDSIKIFKYITKKLNIDIKTFDYIKKSVKSCATKISKYIFKSGFCPKKHQLVHLLRYAADIRAGNLFKWIVENYCKTTKGYNSALGAGFRYHLFRPVTAMWLLRTCYKHGVDFNTPAYGYEPVMFYLFDKDVTGGYMEMEANLIIRTKKITSGLAKYIDYLVNHGYNLNKTRDSLGRNIHEYLSVNSIDYHSDDYYLNGQKLLYWVLNVKKSNQKYDEIRLIRKTEIPHNYGYVKPEYEIEE